VRSRLPGGVGGGIREDSPYPDLDLAYVINISFLDVSYLHKFSFIRDKFESSQSHSISQDKVGDWDLAR
jgi:hypothetical protein